MVAKITDKLKKQLVQQVFDELTGEKLGDSDNYFYMAIGRSQEWSNEQSPDVPFPHDREEKLFRYNMQSLKAVQGFSFVVPLEETKDWSSGSVYAAYSDASTGQSANYYVRTEDNNVYVCIRQGKEGNGTARSSVDKPDHTDTTLIAEVNDGYIWKYLYTISTADGNSFLTSNFMPVKYVDSADATDPYFGQYTIQNAAVSGQIVGYRVITAGSGYNTSDTVTITGNGSGATGHVIPDGSGGIASVEIGDSARAGTTGFGDLSLYMGSGYARADVSISGGSGGKVVPVFGPKAGLGADPRDDLRSTALMFNVKLQEADEEGNGGKFQTGNDYRQVGIWKNPLQYGSSSQFTGTAATAVSKIKLVSTPSTPITYEDTTTVTGSASTAAAYIDYAGDSDIWIHQTEETGFKDFQVADTLSLDPVQTGLGTLTVDTIENPEVDIFSGDLLYISNISATIRNTGGSEDLKVIVKL